MHINCAGVSSVHDLCLHGNGGTGKCLAYERLKHPVMVDLAPLLGGPDVCHHPRAACRQSQLAELRSGLAPVDDLAGSPDASSEHVCTFMSWQAFFWPLLHFLPFSPSFSRAAALVRLSVAHILASM
jgi:hypothetical protein